MLDFDKVPDFIYVLLGRKQAQLEWLGQRLSNTTTALKEAVAENKQLKDEVEQLALSPAIDRPVLVDDDASDTDEVS